MEGLVKLETLEKRGVHLNGQAEWNKNLLELYGYPGLRRMKENPAEILQKLKTEIEAYGPDSKIVSYSRDYLKKLETDIQKKEEEVRLSRLEIRRIELFLKLEQEEKDFDSNKEYKTLQRKVEYSEARSVHIAISGLNRYAERLEQRFREVWQAIKGHRTWRSIPGYPHRSMEEARRSLSNAERLLESTKARLESLKRDLESRHPQLVERARSKIPGTTEHVHRLEIYILKIKPYIDDYDIAEADLRDARRELKEAGEGDHKNQRSLEEWNLRRKDHLKETKTALKEVEDELLFLELSKHFS